MKTSLIIVSFFLSALSMHVVASNNGQENSNRLLTLTDFNFEQQVSNRLVLIDFWASWCGPCRMMSPILHDVSDELTHNKYIGKVDVEAYPGLAQRYNIRGIPTLILLQNGKEIKRFVGLQSKEFILQQMQLSSK